MEQRKALLVIIGLFLSLMAGAQDIAKCYAFEGTLNGRVAVRLAFEVNAEGIAAGAIYYPKAKHPAQILIVGKDEGNGQIRLREFQDNGYVTGFLTLEIKGGQLTGNWWAPTMGEELAFTAMHSIPFPESFGGKLVPESPGSIGKEYRYSYFHENAGKDVGGTAEFRAAGKDRVHFSINNSSPKHAEGESQKGRPAVLDGNVFEYTDVNECGYGFRATFFKKFVVVETTTGDQSLECFPPEATLDGVYIKLPSPL